jgi:selenocysteine-specific translation elongation factor
MKKRSITVNYPPLIEAWACQRVGIADGPADRQVVERGCTVAVTDVPGRHSQFRETAVKSRNLTRGVTVRLRETHHLS